MGQINFGLRVVAFFWKVHFRIPEAGFWAILGGSLLIGIPTLGAAIPITLVCLLGLVIGVQGIVRWRITRRKARSKLVVPLFRCGSPEKAIEIRDTIVKTLQDHLSPEEMKVIYLLPAIVGLAQRDFAAKLCARLRAFVLLQGEIRQEAGGAWSVYAATCHRDANIRHIDPHTRDETPAKVRWKWAFENLSGVPNIPQTEYPLEFAHELRAVIQGIAGQVSEYLGDPERAVTLLDEAIAVAPTSTSPQIDQLRLFKAKALAAVGKRTEGLELLRARCQEGDASADLLRTLAHLLVAPSGGAEEAEALEAMEVLRKAAEDRSDPRRDQTLYNLSQLTMYSPNPADRDEATALMLELSNSSSHYGDAWYVKRALGSMAYGKFLEGFHAGKVDKERAAEAARWYSRAIRARPKVRFFFTNPRSKRVEVISRFQTPPIMFGNAKDGHHFAGHRFRSAWYEMRFQVTRRRFMWKGERAMRKGKYRSAIAWFDWVASVGRHDALEGDAFIELKTAQGMRDEQVAEGIRPS